MAEVFVPHGYASKSFWPTDKGPERATKLPDSAMVDIQPFSVYQLEHPHIVRKRPGHYGAMPRCRANATESLDLVRKVLQPAINYDVVEIFKRYISVFRDAADNISVNMRTESFANCATDEELNVENMVYKACCDALDHCKTLFSDKRPVKVLKTDVVKSQATASASASKPSPLAASSLSNRLMMKRVPSPDFPWTKRLAGKGSPRRSLSPTPRPAKRGRPTPTRRYGSPTHPGREPLNRENWDPEKLTTDTSFIMGTRANKALGLGATRGRIYMKHPELFKYSSDPEDKKWMVKNNCMLATGGKNTFILIADDVCDLMDHEYKESPHIQPEEMQTFKLPEFILQKMRALMLKEKRLTQKLMRKPESSPLSRSEIQVKSEGSPRSEPKFSGSGASPHHSRRPAAERAAAVITATTEDMDEASNERNAFLEQSDADSSSADDTASDYAGNESGTQ